MKLTYKVVTLLDKAVLFGHERNCRTCWLKQVHVRLKVVYSHKRANKVFILSSQKNKRRPQTKYSLWSPFAIF